MLLLQGGVSGPGALQGVSRAEREREGSGELLLRALEQPFSNGGYAYSWGYFGVLQWVL